MGLMMVLHGTIQSDVSKTIKGKSINMRNINLYAVILLVVFSSCSNSLDIIDPVDPIPVVYFQLNPDESFFYLTLTRTFSGDGSAFDLARDPNQVFYESADIRLEGWSDQYKVSECQFELTDRSKIPGIFPEIPGYCFESVNDFHSFDEIASFRLVIHLLGMASPAFSRIPVFAAPTVPSRFDHEIALYPDNYTLQFSIDRKVKYCDLLCEFHYQEYEGTWVDHSVSFSLRKDIMIIGTRAATFLYPELFFNKIAANVKPVNDTIVRKFTSLDLIFYAGDIYFRDYVDTYGNAGDLDLPPKGNITNGLGLFTMRRSATKPDMTFDRRTHDSLCLGQYTKQLGFVRW
jgi:hypothetical protein